MKKLRVMLAAVLATAVVAVNPAAAQPPPNNSRKPEAAGSFNLNVHTHSPADPDARLLRLPVDQLPYDFNVGEDFSYVSRPCSQDAPFNQVGLNFQPPYPGFDNPIPVRHHVVGNITKGDETAEGLITKGTVEGTITTVICEPGPTGQTQTESEHSILTAFRGHFKRVSDSELRINGSYTILGGTGTFENMTGHGSIHAALVCLSAFRGGSTCKDLGEFTDFTAPPPPSELFPKRAGLVGSYKDPDVTTG